MLTTTQKKTAEAIVNIFETGSVLGDYGNVTVIPGDTGHLTYGRSQTTLGSGNLHKLLKQYCDSPVARFGDDLLPFLPRFANKDERLDAESHVKNILRAAADDKNMRDIQDVFFDKTYWQPAEQVALQLGITTPLGITVVYDSMVHGSGALIRDKTNQAIGTLAQVGERKWISTYVQIRHGWLANHARDDLRPTVYRMDAFDRLIELDQWELELPLVVRGREISSLTLSAAPTGCYDGPQPGSRPLALQTPLLRGLDVRLVQLGLSKSGMKIVADGVFGKGSLAAVMAFQTTTHLPATGTLDIALVRDLAG